MRSIIWATLLLASIVGLVIVDNILIHGTTAEMSGALAAVQNATDIYAEIEKCEAVWEKHSSRLHFLIDHADIDRISVGIIKIRKYSEFGEDEELAAETAELKFFIEHMPEKERLTLRNIF